MNVPPLIIGDAPPPLLPQPGQKPGFLRRLFVILLNLALGIFLAAAAVSVADDFLVLICNCRVLSPIAFLFSIGSLLLAVAVYGFLGLTPLVPKRFFLPIPLSYLVSLLALFPLMTYFYSYLLQIDLAVSIFQLGIALMILYFALGGWKFRGPPVKLEQLGARAFSWTNLSVFALVNLFVLLPAVAVYLFASLAGAVSHFSQGFMALHPSGLTVQMRKYVRDDGKMIELFPMAHVADPDFYRTVSRSIPTNGIILMEGVTDTNNVLTNQISYKRMARSLGLAEQKQTFTPISNKVVRADVDVSQFSKETLGFLNLAMIIHSKGVSAENLMMVMQYSPSPDFETQLFDDILTKRNQHLLEEIQSHLLASDNLMVPWGVAHMPGIAQEIQKSGFHLEESHDYFVIRFHKARDAEDSTRSSQ